LDPYEIRARFAPTLIVVSPWVLMAVVLAEMNSLTFITGSGFVLVFVVLLYAVSFVVRQLGLRIQKKLWTLWGGPPSTILMSDGDNTFSQTTKREICTFLVDVLDVRDAGQPNWADNAEAIKEAFRLVRQYIRQHDPNGLWFKHVAEYGFLRNIMGSWWLWLTNSVLVAVICGYIWYVHSTMILVVLMVSVMFGMIAIAARIFILPSAVKTAGICYAKSAWMSFLTTAKTGQTKNQGDNK
ncbi:hypothetical protein LCGC14_3066090, partial [marine sediment metagenome]